MTIRHDEYNRRLETYLNSRCDEPEFFIRTQHHAKEIEIMKNLNTDPVVPLLESLYSPGKLKSAKDPACMLRSLILMVLLKFSSITNWVKETKKDGLLAVLAGFKPHRAPGIGTYYDFMRRIINGPYQKPCRCHNQVKHSQYNAGPHRRNIKKEKEAQKNDLDPNHSQSEKLARELLDNAEKPRDPGKFQLLEDLLIQLAVIPSIEAGLITDLQKLIVSGDGSILQTAASANGKPLCSCRSEGVYKCDHDRHYTSPTARWCYDHVRDAFVFGDRYYHIVTTQNGHDFPLLTYMRGGNESDYTLSLTSFDRLLKAVRENGLDMDVYAFCGDGHHDAYAHYQYFREKDVIPVIPLSENSRKAYPHLSDDGNIRLDEDGTPLCPAGKRMRRHCFDKKKQTHVYNCPAKRNTHRKGKSMYVFYEDECPLGRDCNPESPLGPYVSLKSADDPRLFPPLPRDSQKFKDLMKQRSASERVNAVNDSYGVEKSCRNADYGLIRLILANIAHHCTTRYVALKNNAADEAMLSATIETATSEVMPAYADST